MSSVTLRKTDASTQFTASSPPFTLFTFDTGTTNSSTHPNPSGDHLQSLAVLHHPPAPSASASSHSIFSSQIRPPIWAPLPNIPSFPAVWKSTITFIRKHTRPSTIPLLIAHHAPFDTAFLLAELSRRDMPLPDDLLFADSLTLARKTLPGLLKRGRKPYSQESLAEHFGIHIEKAHVAELDVVVLAKILDQLDRELRRNGRSLIQELEMDAVPLEEMAKRFTQGKPPQRDASKPYLVTASKKKFHVTDKCNGLRNAGSWKWVKLPESSTSPCKLCVGKEHVMKVGIEEETSMVTKESGSSTARNGSSSHSRVIEEDSGSSGSGGYIVAPSGNRYHVDMHCYVLRKSKNMVTVKKAPPGLKACSLCCKNVGDTSLLHSPTSVIPKTRRVLEEEEGDDVSHVSHVSGGSTVRSQRSTKKGSLGQFGSRFYKGNTGAKFHIKDCRHVKLNPIACKPIEENRDPCRTCLGDLYQQWKTSSWLSK